jgi:hypothetical protein
LHCKYFEVSNLLERCGSKVFTEKVKIIGRKLIILRVGVGIITYIRQRKFFKPLTMKTTKMGISVADATMPCSKRYLNHVALIFLQPSEAKNLFHNL